MEKLIAISLSPNTLKEDIYKAVCLLFSPCFYFKNNRIERLEDWFKKYFNVSYAFSFNSGRSGLYAILKSLKIGKDGEVILQAFTCVVVPNAIIALGAKPIYVDINSQFVLDLKELEKKITSKTKAIIVQHTFGIPTDMKKIMEISKKYKIPIIEDVAHTIGGEFEGRKLGQFGIASFFSFGRDKAFSSVFGGMVITNDKSLGENLRDFHDKLDKPSYIWTIQQILHPILFAFILSIYQFSIGKALLLILQKLKVLSVPVSKDEKKGKFYLSQVKKFANPLASLILFQLKRIEEINNKRKLIGEKYIKELQKLPIEIPYKNPIFYLRFPILVENRNALKVFFRKHNVYIGDWYVNTIDPKDVILQDVYYKKGLCPKAENACKNVLNLPTHPKMTNEDVDKIIYLLKKYYA